MSKKIYDIRDYLDDKRIYTSLLGHDIDFSFRPVAIDEMYKKYVDLEGKVANSMVAYTQFHQEYVKVLAEGVTEEQEKGYTEKTLAFQELVSDAKQAGINMISVMANLNGKKEVDEDWINHNIDAREFGFIIRFIMGTEDAIPIKKNSKNKK